VLLLLLLLLLFNSRPVGTLPLLLPLLLTSI
jgi:hypothetical protein